MGCDIHLYCEYRDAQDGNRWRSWGNQFNLGRNYRIFEVLAGVRGDLDQAIVRPRGLPEDVGYVVHDDNHLYISESGGERTVTADKAAQWVASGCSRYRDHEGKHTWVTHPDWHSHSWLSLAEYQHALARLDGGPPEYGAIAAALAYLETQNCVTRIVFWFDN